VIGEIVLSAALLAGFVAREPIKAPVAPVSIAPAPAPVADDTPSLEQQFLKNFLRDQKAIWTSPYHIRSADAKWLVPLIAGTAAFVITDRRALDHFSGSPDLLRSGEAISYAGSATTIGAAAAAFYVVGRVTHNAKARETGLLATEALLDSAVVGSVLKLVTQRARPDAGDTRSEFFSGGRSFPSGHTIHIWSFASVVAHEYSGHRWVGFVAYGTAAAVGAARIAAQRHYLSDVLVGGALGYAIGKYVYRTHQRLDRQGAPATASRVTWPAISVRYAPAAREYGVTFAWTPK
jgi:membrane-associated phospholipid phosphatase